MFQNSVELCLCGKLWGHSIKKCSKLEYEVNKANLLKTWARICKRLRSPGIDPAYVALRAGTIIGYDNPIFRNGPSGCIGWRNRSLGIDSWTSETFKNSDSDCIALVLVKSMRLESMRARSQCITYLWCESTCSLKSLGYTACNLRFSRGKITRQRVLLGRKTSKTVDPVESKFLSPLPVQICAKDVSFQTDRCSWRN